MSETFFSLKESPVNKGYQRFHFHHAESENPKVVNRLNPKWAQRLANKAMRSRGISTKAQVTLQKQFEEKKKLRKTKRTNKNRLNKEIRYQKRVVKHRKKHRGH